MPFYDTWHTCDRCDIAKNKYPRQCKEQIPEIKRVRVQVRVKVRVRVRVKVRARVRVKGRVRVRDKVRVRVRVRVKVRVGVRVRVSNNGESISGGVGDEEQRPAQTNKRTLSSVSLGFSQAG